MADPIFPIDRSQKFTFQDEHWFERYVKLLILNLDKIDHCLGRQPDRHCEIWKSLFEVQLQNSAKKTVAGSPFWEAYEREAGSAKFDVMRRLTYLGSVSPTAELLTSVYPNKARAFREKYENYTSIVFFGSKLEIAKQMLSPLSAILKIEFWVEPIRKNAVIHVPKQHLQKVMAQLGIMGGFSKSILINLLCGRYKTLQQRLNLFSIQIAARLNKNKLVFNSLCQTHSLPFVEQKAEGGHAFLLNSLELYKCIVDGIDASLERFPVDDWRLEQRGFYLLFVKQMLQGIFESQSAEIKTAPEMALQLNLIYFLLSEAERGNYNTFLDCVGLIADEFMRMSSLVILKTSASIYGEDVCHRAFLNVVQRATKLIANHVGESPNYVSFDSSGMGALTHWVHAILKQLTNGNEDPIGVYVDSGVYFELSRFLDSYIPGSCPYDSENTKFWTNGKDVLRKPSNAPVSFAHLIIASPEHNVSTKHTSDVKRFGCTDIEALIDEQLKLRSKDYDKPLIVLLDTTISCRDEIFIPGLLLTFEEKIKSGKLLLVVCDSLNKNFSLGLDKTQAGLVYLYGKISNFLHIERQIKFDTHNQYLGGNSPLFPMFIFMERFMKHCSNLITDYPSISRGRRRFLQERCFQDFKPGYLSIDNPCTEGQLGGKKIPALNNVHNFVVLRFNATMLLNHANSKNIQLLLQESMFQLLEEFGIKARVGFGFAETAFTCIRDDKVQIIRIHIGSESVDYLQQRFDALTALLNKLNRILKCSPIYQGRKGDPRAEKRFQPIVHTSNFLYGKHEAVYTTMISKITNCFKKSAQLLRENKTQCTNQIVKHETISRPGQRKASLP